MRTTTILSLIVMLAAGCASSLAMPVPDSALGLAKGSVFDVPTPPPVKDNDTSPGERPPLPRPYAIAPPRVPHGVSDFLPITRAQNACLDCHNVAARKPGEPTPLPVSHFTDYRNAPERVGSQPAGARYVCVSCHVATTDVPSLVQNPAPR